MEQKWSISLTNITNRRLKKTMFLNFFGKDVVASFPWARTLSLCDRISDAQI